MQRQEERISNKSAKVLIVGLGYVGLPLALAFSEAGYEVLGFDIQQKRVDAVNRGHSYIADVNEERLRKVIANRMLEATTKRSRFKEADVICICVPTPITKTKDPDLSYVIQESKNISKYLESGQLVVLESTTYPGTTREVVLPILETSGLRIGEEFFLAYSPERVDPGSNNYGINNTPKIVGGITTQCTELAKLLYSYVTESIVTVSSLEVAEMTKVFENVFRSVNIALVNELSQLCQKMKVSVWEVINTASTKPYGYMPFFPGPGTGGHCIPLDPYYLASKAREHDFHTRFIELAAEINENMPTYIVSRIMEVLNDAGQTLNRAKVLILGVAYKKDVGDMRESPVLKIVQLLNDRKASISYHDPYIQQITLSNDHLTSIEFTEDNISSADCVVLATDHTYYDMDKVTAWAKLVFDIRGATRGINKENIVRLGE